MPINLRQELPDSFLLAPPEGEEPILKTVADLLDRTKIEQTICRTVEKFRRRIFNLSAHITPEDQTTIARIAGIEKRDFSQVAAEWFVRTEFFRFIGQSFGLEEVQTLPGHLASQFLALTYRGSILTGNAPDSTGKRDIEYMRIPSRTKHWRGEWTHKGVMPDLHVNQQVHIPDFIRHTSPLKCILVVPPDKSDIFAHITEIVRNAVLAQARLL